jgi:hypothetical protein
MATDLFLYSLVFVGIEKKSPEKCIGRKNNQKVSNSGFKKDKDKGGFKSHSVVYGSYFSRRSSVN